jgi:hypothetical protein
LYIWSSGDVALSREAAEATGGHIDGPYTFEAIEGGDHWVPEHSAEVVNPALLGHFARATR